MIIKEIHIDSFGMFSDFSLSLADGLNIIEGKNETGKSTLGMFIKFIFYGLDSKEREKYIPWGRNSAGGYMVIRHGDKNYTVRRQIILLQKGVKEEVYVTDTETGTIVFKDKPVHEIFMSVDEKVFSNTVYVGQINGSFVEGAKLSDAVENILFSADEMINTSKALKRLDELRCSLLYKNKKGGKIYELGEKIAELEIRLSKSRQDNVRVFDLEDKIHQSKQKKEDNIKSISDISAKLDEYDAYSQIERKQRSDEASQAAVKAKQAYDTALAENTKNGFFPDTKYAADLYSLQNDINRKRTELTEAEKELENAENDLSVYSESAEIIDKINAHGGRSAVEEKVASLKKKYKNLRIAGFIFLILIIGIFFLVAASKVKKQLGEYLEEFGCEDSEQLESILSQLNEQEQSIAHCRMSIENAAGRCESIRADITKTEQAIYDEAGKFENITEITDSSVEDVARKAEKAIQDVTGAKQEFEKSYSTAQALIRETAHISIDDMRSRIKGKLRASELETFDVNEQKRRLDFLQRATESLNEKILQLEKEYSSLCATVEDPSAISDELLSLRTQYGECVSEYKACVLAYETLENASKTLRDGISPKLAKLSGGFMEKLSGGKYCSIGIDGEYGIYFTESGTSRHVSAFSSGTEDLAYICLRFALTDILYRNGKPPMIFDDTFAHIDDDRLENIIALLSAMGKAGKLQTIVLSCHKRERSIAMSCPETNIIRMES